MKHITKFFLLACSFLCACSSSNTHKLRVAASPTPHAIILESIKDDLKKEGVDLQIIQVLDYNVPDRALADKDVDANYFQHEQFLQSQIAQYHYCLVPIAKIHIEPLGLYSASLTSLKDLPDGAKVAIPNDPTNEARALYLLQSQGLIELSSVTKSPPTVLSISANPKNLKFLEVDAALLPRVLHDVALAAIPTNYALQANLTVSKNALASEGPDSPYVNVLVVRCGEENREDLVKLKQALTSDKTRQFILDHFHGEVIPAF